MSKSEVVNENLSALRNAMTATISRKLADKLLGVQRSAKDTLSLAAASSVLADASMPNTLHGDFLRLVSRSLCVVATDDLLSAARSVISSDGEPYDAATHSEMTKELESAFNGLSEQLGEVSKDVSKFSTQQEKVIVASATDKDNNDNAIVIEKGNGNGGQPHIPANHVMCERCHNPGKKSKSKVLELKRPELMPDEIAALHGKMLCPKCLTEVNAIIAAAIRKEEEAIKAQAKADKEREEKEEKLLVLKAEEKALADQIKELEEGTKNAPASLKKLADEQIAKCKLSIQAVREQIQSLTTIPMGPAKPAAPSVVKALTKKERKAQRRALMGK